MTKAEIVNEIAGKTGFDKGSVQTIVEVFMSSVKSSMIKGDNVYLRGFGSFIIKQRAQKTARIFPKKKRSQFLPTIFRLSNLARLS